MRKLTAILFSDIVGFSKKMAANEADTLAILESNNTLHRDVIGQFGGVIVKAMGDGFMCTFASSLDAIVAGTELCRRIEKHGQYELRVGIHVGDIVHEANGDVYGDGVNIAARIESNAPSPGVWVSERIANDLVNHPFISFQSAGLFNFKNIPKPMEIFQAVISDQQDLTPKAQPAKTSFKLSKLHLTSIAAVLIVVGAALGWKSWQDSMEPETLAVLPFQYIGEDDRFAFQSQAFTNELTIALGDIDSLRVLSEITAQKMQESSTLISDLEVDLVVQGTLTFIGEQRSVQIRLIDTDSDDTLWLETYPLTTEETAAAVAIVRQAIINQLY